MEDMTTENSEISELLFLIEENKIKLSEAHRAKVKEVALNILTVRTKISDASASSD